jgi:acyl-CoA synthetase (AMP-forming)/AMP-acid ligase II
MAPRLRALIAGHAAADPFVSDARSSRSIDRRALAAAADIWTGELAARGVAPGARVLLDVDDPLTFTVAHLSVVAAGRCSAPVDPGAPAAATARTRSVIAPALVLTDRPERPGVLLTRGGLPAAPVGSPSRVDAGPG